ncbi:hypothetical protein Sm713_67490 [Streptomyces sp. TS71-3]|nr:hypothetical protein Sm713_67490 [Streptomyces sp. TS71-3]
MVLALDGGTARSFRDSGTGRSLASDAGGRSTDGQAASVPGAGLPLPVTGAAFPPVRGLVRAVGRARGGMGPVLGEGRRGFGRGF